MHNVAITVLWNYIHVPSGYQAGRNISINKTEQRPLQVSRRQVDAAQIGVRFVLLQSVSP